MKYIHIFSLAILLIMGYQSIAAQENTILIKFEGFNKGDSQHPSYPGGDGYFELIAYNAGGSSSGTTHMGQGGGGSKAAFPNIFATINSTAFPTFLQHATEATIISQVEILYLCTSCTGHNNEPFRKTIIKNVLINSFTLGVGEGANQFIVNLGLNYEAIKRQYWATIVGGALATTPNEMMWNIKNNTPTF